MNAKTCKALRRQVNFHPKQVTSYVAHIQRTGQFNKDAPTGVMVDPESIRGRYLALKKAHRS